MSPKVHWTVSKFDSFSLFFLMKVQNKKWSGLYEGILSTERKKESEVSQSCLTLCNSIVCSLPGSSVHGIFQARILEWVAISFSRASSQPRDRTQVSYIAGRHLTIWATREAHIFSIIQDKCGRCQSFKSTRNLFPVVPVIFLWGKKTKKYLDSSSSFVTH